MTALDPTPRLGRITRAEQLGHQLADDRLLLTVVRVMAERPSSILSKP